MEVGEVFGTNEGGQITILENDGWDRVVIKHNDEHGHIMVVERGRILRGAIKNPFKRSVVGVGYYGVGKHKSRTADKYKYNLWKNMIIRCYCQKYQRNQPTYIGCTVDASWHNFQTFGDWYDLQYTEDGWQLDKDIIHRGNKMYSPDTCRMVPAKINALLNENRGRGSEIALGVSRHGNGYRAHLSVNNERIHFPTRTNEQRAFEDYKDAKEENIRRMANEYKHTICPQLYNALIQYKIVK